MGNSEIVFAMTADTQDVAFGEMHAFIKALQAAGLGKLQHAKSEQKGSTEIFIWAQDSDSPQLEAEIRDDDHLPAMYLVLRGSTDVVAAASELAVDHFGLAPIAEVVRLAQQEFEDDPSLLLMAALVTDRAHRGEVTDLLAKQVHHRDKSVRKAVVQAAGILADEAARKIVVQAVNAETDAKLKQGMERVLARFPPAST